MNILLKYVFEYDGRSVAKRLNRGYHGFSEVLAPSTVPKI